MKKSLILLCAVTMIIVTAPAAFAVGSLAMDSNQGSSYGWAINYGSQAAADQAVLSQCGQSCSVVMRFSHTCAAYSADSAGNSTAYGWAYAANLSTAQSNATAYCQERGGTSCVIRAYGCDR
jgi:hypothetical protein